MHVSRDLLNRPRFQFHASEFDSGGERESLAGNIPSGRRDGRRGVEGRENL